MNKLRICESCEYVRGGEKGPEWKVGEEFRHEEALSVGGVGADLQC